MNRRQFLTNATGFYLFNSFTSNPLTKMMISPTLRYKWSEEGRIFKMNADEWQEVINFGSDCQIIQLVQYENVAKVQLAYQNRRFWLHTIDGKTWRTYKRYWFNFLR